MAGFDYLQAMFFLKCIAFLIKKISQRREHGRRVRLARIRSSAKRRMQLYRMFKARKLRALISTVLMMNNFKQSNILPSKQETIEAPMGNQTKV